jgi:hypothetical protein
MVERPIPKISLKEDKSGKQTRIATHGLGAETEIYRGRERVTCQDAKATLREQKSEDQTENVKLTGGVCTDSRTSRSCTETH